MTPIHRPHECADIRLMYRTSNPLYADAMIAATTDAHGLTVVTRSVVEVKPIGVLLLNPFVAARR